MLKWKSGRTHRLVLLHSGRPNLQLTLMSSLQATLREFHQWRDNSVTLQALDPDGRLTRHNAVSLATHIATQRLSRSVGKLLVLRRVGGDQPGDNSDIHEPRHACTAAARPRVNDRILIRHLRPTVTVDHTLPVHLDTFVWSPTADALDGILVRIRSLIFFWRVCRK